MDTGSVSFPGGYGAAWVIVPRRRFFGWFLYSAISIAGQGTVTGQWSFWTRRGARAKMGRWVAEVAVFSESKKTPEPDDDLPTMD